MSNGAVVERRFLNAIGVLALAVLTPWSSAHAGVSDTGTWRTTLQGRDLDGNLANGVEAYFDTELSVTWLADANYRLTDPATPTASRTGVGAGQMHWLDARAWVQGLQFGGVGGWRLPNVTDVGAPGCNLDLNEGDCGGGKVLNPDTSELAHLYYRTLGNQVAYAKLDPGVTGTINTGPFAHAASTYPQDWMTAYFYLNSPSLDGSGRGWGFSPHQGVQDDWLNWGWVWAVHDGDIGTPAIPEPSTQGLMLLGLVALMGKVRRRSARA